MIVNTAMYIMVIVLVMRISLMHMSLSIHLTTLQKITLDMSKDGIPKVLLGIKLEYLVD